MSEEYALVVTDAKPPIAGFEERSLDHAGSRIRYLVGGSGPPILLLHGLGGAVSNWLLSPPSSRAGTA